MGISRLRRGIIGAAAVCLLAMFASPVMAATAASAAPAVAGPHFRFKTFDVPNSVYTEVYGINDRGVLVGQYIDTNGISHGFIALGRRIISVDVTGVGSVGAGLSAINNFGTAVGTWADSTGTYHSFIRSPSGVITTINDPNAGPWGTSAAGVNNLGEVTGLYLDSSSAQHGFLYRNGKFITIDAPGYQNTDVWGINDFGVVDGLGFTVTPVFSQMPFTLSTKVPGATFRSFSAPGQPVYSGAINNFGVVVGHSNDTVFIGWEQNHWTLTTISDPLADNTPATGNFGGTAAAGINDFGTVVGIYFDSTGTGHGFIAYPTR